MKLAPVVNCEACLRATREWSDVAHVRGGVAVVTYRLCRRCESDVLDAVRRTVRELRGAAVQR